VKLLVDMNLSPSWVDRLARHGFDAVHWSTIGAATAADHEILAWAHQHGSVLVTNDLDFSAILAAGAVHGRASSNFALRTCSRRAPRASSPGHSKRIVRTSSEARSYRSTTAGRA
jgi:predicted nuclease of predicted toxin-antitoxin system